MGTIRGAFFKSLTLLAGAMIGVLTMAGCSGPDDEVSGAGTQNTTPVPTETVEAPGGGTIDDVVPDGEAAVTIEATLGESVSLPDGVAVEVVHVEKLEVTAQTPGEVAGPAVAVTVRIDNGSSTDLAVGSVIVTVQAETFGLPTTSEPSAPMMGVLDPGSSATGTYVFLLPEDDRDRLAITVEHAAGAPVAIFTS